MMNVKGEYTQAAIDEIAKNTGCTSEAVEAAALIAGVAIIGGFASGRNPSDILNLALGVSALVKAGRNDDIEALVAGQENPGPEEEAQGD